jgi:hypothetical protein
LHPSDVMSIKPHNKRMQSDIFSRCAPENAADARRYVAREI